MKRRLELTQFGTGYGLGCAFAHGGVFYAFATRFDLKTSWSEIVEFESTDLKSWRQHPVIPPEHEHLFNSSVCKTDDGFVMAYESDDQQYVPFTIKFAHSVDLQNWTKLPDAIFGKDRYTACPAVRFCNGWFYLLYLESKPPKYETYVARSRDLVRWELSSRNPCADAWLRRRYQHLGCGFGGVSRKNSDLLRYWRSKDLVQCEACGLSRHDAGIL